MLNKSNLVAMSLIAGVSVTTASIAEVSTLFTTPQERHLINSNRYKSNEVKPQAPQEDQPEVVSIQQLVQEERRDTMTVSGITLSNSGPAMVWINDQSYEDGETMENNSRIKVMAGNDIKVRITAPDGKQYFATSGETIEVVYLATVEN